MLRRSQFLRTILEKPPLGYGMEDVITGGLEKSTPTGGDVTVILEAIGKGEVSAAEELLSLVYDELRRLAAAKMARERPGQTLQPTALVHEVWLRLLGSQKHHWENRRHFFAAAAESMRRLLIDRARHRATREKQASAQHAERGDSMFVVGPPSDEILAVHEAIDELADEEPMAADLVKLRYFVGMTMPEAAEALDISLRKAERLWTFARAWLRTAVQS
jgi:RNA polymerase sigma factor (TIGR02999 family)